MRALRIAALLLGVFAGSASAEPTVILLSWDGVRHDYPDRVVLPGLERMMREGARAERLLPVFPSNTFPGHVSLATGTHPDRHGVVDNRFIDRERGVFSMANDASWIQAEPLWVAAERQGVPAAVFFWVGSESDWQGLGARYRVTPFDSSIGEAEKVERLLSWLDLPEAERPRLLMGWWHGADHAGHRNGPDDESVDAALLEQDAHLGTLLRGLDAREAWDDTTLLVVSDHGMTRVLGEIPVRDHVKASGIPGRVQSGTAVAHVFLDDPADLERALASLRELEHVTVYRGEELPAALRLRHETRTGDIVALAKPGYVFRGTSFTARAWRLLGRVFGWATGMHGYRPDHPDMGAILFALGRGVTAGTRLQTVHSIDVAPTVAALLGIDPPLHAEGNPISGLLP